MTRSRRLLAVALVAAFLAGPQVAGALAGPSGASPPAAGDYTLEELRTGGAQVPNAAPSMRWVGDAEALYVDYENSNPARRSGGDSWKAGTLLGTERGPVDVDTLRFHAQGPKTADKRTYTLQVVYWQTRMVNGSERLTEVSTEEKRLTFTQPRGVVEATLSSHFKETFQVTMWLEKNGEPIDGARWRFAHHTAETQKSVPIDTAGDRLWWLFTSVIVYVVGLGFLAIAAIFGAKKRAGSGPDKGYFWWGFVLSILGGGVILFAYDSMAALLVDAEMILVLLCVALLSIPILETDWSSRRVLFARPKIADPDAGLQEQELAPEFDADTRKVVKMPNGDWAVAEPGLRKFLARLFGKAAFIEGLSNPEGHISLDGTIYDELVVADPHAEEALDYEPEGWGLDVPTGGRRLLTLGLLAVMFGSITVGLGWGYVGAAAAIPLMIVRPKSASATVEPASIHQQKAFVSMLTASSLFSEADSLDQARERIVELESRQERKVERALNKRDSTLIQEAILPEGADVSLEREEAADPTEDLGDPSESTGERSTKDAILDRVRGESDD